jgi:hypothetical protein
MRAQILWIMFDRLYENHQKYECKLEFCFINDDMKSIPSDENWRIEKFSSGKEAEETLAGALSEDAINCP